MKHIPCLAFSALTFTPKTNQLKTFMRRTLFTALLGLCMAMSASSLAAQAPMTGYLFAYFTSNTTDGQQLRLALSRNGLDYEPLCGGQPVANAKDFTVSGGIRDPHILRCDDGWFRMVMTDMDMSNGKWTCRGFIMSRSRDLIHWTHSAVDFPTRYKGKPFAQANAVWAPQTIYDESTGKYMVYFSLHSEKTGPYPKDAVYYAYANADFTGLESDPQPLFSYKYPTIDTDIVKDEKGTYHLFFNTWGGSEGLVRKQYAFTDLHSPETWTLVPGRMQPNKLSSEGSCAFPLIDGSGWILMYDCFKDGKYQFCKTTDWKHFELVRETKTEGGFTPRHGTTIQITEEEYQRLKGYYRYAFTEKYHPDGQSFVCVNGNNRYTRALYGSHTTWRLETSDRPVFATWNGNTGNRNISFFASGQPGRCVALDSTDYCEARYTAGRRDYVLRDSTWNGGSLEVSVLAFPDSEGGVFRFVARNFPSQVRLRGEICENRLKKFVRFGDIGKFEPHDKFEADVEKKGLQTVNAEIDDTLYIVLERQELSVAASGTEYCKAESYRESLASTVVFTTPDQYINPIGGALVMAADGAWDGKVWNHGAIGWRMPLTGWRGAYAGDFLGMADRQRIHFDAYAKSQVTDVPVTQPHLMDRGHNLSRGAYKWGTPMYSNGYICRNPNNNKQFHHYDMNLVYIDELLWHFQFNADTAYMRKMWPVITSHLAWEKNTWDPDNDHLYDAYCCIWASDALGYNSGAVTHSSAYNYRHNRLAARIAEILGEDGTPYKNEADAILKAMNERLWTDGHWAEYQDFMGLKRLHKSAALWSIYTPIDSEACSDGQAFQATQYVDKEIPHFTFTVDGRQYETISTTNWTPYEWSLNNVAMAEVLHTALCYWQAGRPEEAYGLLKGTMMDFMYTGQSPANFGQTSKLDAAMGEAYRDFTDVTGMASRAFVQGLYGITPQALDGLCVIRPGFPPAWDSASIRTPYMDYSFERRDGYDVYTIRQRFAQPMKIVLRQNLGGGKYKDHEGSADSLQVIRFPYVATLQHSGAPVLQPSSQIAAQGTAFGQVKAKVCQPVDISSAYNASVTGIFRQKYLSPRSPYTTLCIPVQGIGDWCSTKRTANIDDCGLRAAVSNGVFTAANVPFRTPAEGKNIIYTSLWDNYPDSVTIPLKGKASHAYLMMAGSTNPMQSRIANGIVRVEYSDGSSDVLELVNPDNWCPIQEDYLNEATAFPLAQPRPYRVGLKTALVSRDLFGDMHLQTNATTSDVPEYKQALKSIDGGAAVLLDMPLNPKKKLKSLTLSALSNEVVIGLMAVTLQKCDTDSR